MSLLKKKENKVLKWIKENNIGELINEYGYTQKEFAKEIGISYSLLSNIINNRYTRYSNNMQKIYDFFQDKTNKKEGKKKMRKRKEGKTVMLDYLNKYKLKDLCKKLNYKKQDDLALEIGISRQTLMNMFNGYIKNDSSSVKKAYDFIKTKLEKNSKKEENKQEKAKDSINILGGEETMVNEAKKGELEDNKKVEEIKEKKSVKKELKKKNKFLMNRLREETILNIQLLTKLSKKEDKIKKLEEQIRRYEILIDRLK